MALTGGVIAIIFFWWRAGSIHSVLDRLWRLIAGQTEASDPVLKVLLQESRDIEKFQFTYRLKVETMAELHKLTDWMATKNVSMMRLQKVRRWVNVASTEIISLPPKHYAAWRLLFSFITLLSMMPIGLFSSSPDAYLRMRASAVWFKTDGITVNSLMERWSFALQQCQIDKSLIVKTTGFNQSEAESICKALEDGSVKELAAATVKSQAYLGLVGVLIAMIIVLINVPAAISAQEAIRLRKKLDTTT